MTDETKPENAVTEDKALEAETTEDIEVAEVIEESEIKDSVTEQPTAEPKTEQTQKRSGLPVLVGGGLAAVLGFAVAQFVPEGWPLAGSENEEFEAELLQQAQEISSLKDMLSAQGIILDEKLEKAQFVAELQVLNETASQSAASSEESISAVQGDMEQLAQRLTAVEKRPITESVDSSGAVAAYERELQELKETLDAQKVELEATAKEAEAKIAEAKSQAEGLQAGAEATANAALLRAGTSSIASAIESGGSFQTALSDVAQATGQTPSADLTAASLSGVETLVNLRNSFPIAARAALSVPGMEAKGEGTLNRLGAFVRSQTGARSLSPREGEDADAILSRAEAAVGAGDLSLALEEINSLPQAAQDMMADWVKSASYRIETIAAVEAFSDAVSDK